MSLPALYEIAEQYRRLEELTDHEDLPPEVIRDTLEGLEGDLQLKATNVAKFVLGLEAEAEMIEQAAEAMKLRAARRKKRAESIRAYLLFCMQGAGITKISCPEFTLAVLRNPEAVEIDDPQSIPAEFLVQPPPPPPRPDKALLKTALKAGRHIAGAWLRRGERLEIKA